MNNIENEIIIQEIVTDNNILRITCNNKTIRSFGMYLAFNQLTKEYIFIDTRKPLLDYMVIVVDGIIEINALDKETLKESFHNIIYEKDREDKHMSYKRKSYTNDRPKKRLKI